MEPEIFSREYVFGAKGHWTLKNFFLENEQEDPPKIRLEKMQNFEGYNISKIGMGSQS